MNNQFKKIMQAYKEDELLFNRIIVSSFVKANKLVVTNNKLIKSLLLKEGNSATLLPETNFKFGFDELIEAFELAIPNEDKVINGAVYTPNYIKNFIIKKCISKIKKPLNNCLVADISCGCGAFLYTYALHLHEERGKLYSEIFRDNIYGLDISKHSIERTEILLSLLAISSGEDEKSYQFNLFAVNALDFDWYKSSSRIKANEGFDLIIGNPPYVRSKNIDEPSRVLLSKWSVTNSGNTDLYIPFFEIGLNLLNKQGVLGYITVNSFFKSVNARLLRKYFQDNRFGLTIIDFGDEKIFGNKSTYSCICIVTKEESSSVLFIKQKSIDLNNPISNYNSIPYITLNSKKGWLLNDKKIVENIKKIEGCGSPLGELYKIRNGIATLSNDIYIFKPIAEDENYFYLLQDEKKFKIEKAICRDIIKPNILKFEHEIPTVKEKLIYPYTNGISPFSLMPEKILSKSFPKTFKYLSENRETLEKRDKGEGEYPAWYAFGRTQALTDKGFKLLFPYMAKLPHFVFTADKSLLIYCGYAIFGSSADELMTLKKILQSSIFHYYMQNTSKPYSAGYLSYAKNYVKNFGVCELKIEEKNFLLNVESVREVDEFLMDKYKINIPKDKLIKSVPLEI
ncbi:SAM-dependent DNA methyltransferase [Panacibacter ginsenosidivorans]|uniref:site-specific DNA-methyltransferase (adenine-specific) n=1 Tax=Panacibacter ginsenosidivorans TaxID=1813871 RepID=A0A5B8V684_9BACT|nr:N-6 DNA methylase [Panacibacter ginsenosidivorans]QEC66156.1 SAM-dependent DNA methyltransferase [Panacibacter ginsenosidivorans]